MITKFFSPQPLKKDIPILCRDPFNNSPHPIVIRAVEVLQKKLSSQYSSLHPFYDNNGGKMFGVAVIESNEGKIGYLAAFSGMLGQQWLVDGFVPPCFNVNNYHNIVEQGEAELKTIKGQLDNLVNNPQRKQLQNEFNNAEEACHSAVIKFKNLLKDKKEKRYLSRQTLEGVDINNQIQLAELSFESQEDKRNLKTLKRDNETCLKNLKSNLEI